MNKYIRKPYEVEAIYFCKSNIPEIIEWIKESGFLQSGKSFKCGIAGKDEYENDVWELELDGIIFQEGEHYIVKNKDGSFYAYRESSFRWDYEKISDENEHEQT